MDGLIYVAQTNGWIFKYSPTGGATALASYSLGFNQGFGMAVDVNNNVYVNSYSPAQPAANILRLTPTGSVAQFGSAYVIYGGGMTFLGGTMFTPNYGNNYGVYQISSTGSVLTSTFLTISGDGFTGVSGDNNGILWVNDINNNRVFKIYGTGCPGVSSPAFGYPGSCGPLLNGATCSISCYPNSTVSPSSSTCSSNQISPTRSCTPVCALTAPSGGTLGSCGSFQPPSTTCQQACNLFYTLNGTSTSCSSSGVVTSHQNCPSLPAGIRRGTPRHMQCFTAGLDYLPAGLRSHLLIGWLLHCMWHQWSIHSESILYCSLNISAPTGDTRELQRGDHGGIHVLDYM